jgi:fatty-acyl-CoA synthase
MGDWFEKLTYGELVDRSAVKYGDKEYMYFEGGRWSFRQVKEEIDRAARGLMALGIQPGDKVSLWLMNRPEWVFIQFALAKIGAVLVPINTQFRTADLDYVVRQSDTSTLIAADRSGPVDFLAMIQALCPELATASADNLATAAFPDLKRIVLLSEQAYPGVYRWQDVLDMTPQVGTADLARRQEAVDPDATATIMYTSGTTGFPKGVMHNHNIIRNVLDEANRIGIKQTDVVMMYLPLFHAFGIYEGPLMCFATGARMVLCPTFDPGHVLQLTEQEKGTLLHGFDTHFHDLMQHPDFETRDIGSIRTGILASGMSSSIPTARLAQEKFGPLVSGWGMTEAGVGGALGFPHDPPEVNACLSGYPLVGYTFKIIDPDSGQEQPPNTPGELCCQSYMLMQGYYKKPQETAKAIDADGWLHSGDMAYFTEDGYLRFLGRYKEMLKVGGENVDPVELEGHLLQHPAVNQVKVVGVPDERLNEVATACVVLSDGANVLAEELIAFCKDIAHFKRPRHILFMKDYPMTASGKVQKFNLRKIAMQELQLSDPENEA